MYLSRLEIIGFKSFAQRVNLAFDSGISAIVGPNGCGKTNIVDAIRWVLGEQRYSALRSERMEDVIFNGTKQRKPLGMAEVSLMIENTKGILPSEYSQVTVSRRVYRSGESEYLLNKVPCRLKDILDLFMDTGMGADAYSVIELKMVETILSDQAEERRRLFEEAAGVTKYKHRRKAAYRKLESVQADLVRVSDIVTEVHKAVSSLERQARKAGQFNEVKARLKSMEIDLMEREYAQLIARMKPLEERLSVLNLDKDRIDLEMTGEETRLETLRSSLTEVERALAEAQRRVGQQIDQIRGVEQHTLVATERVRALQENVARFSAEKTVLQTEQQQLESLIVNLHERIAESGVEETRTAQQLELMQTDLREFESRLNTKKTELQSLNDRTIALVQEIATLQTAQDRQRARVENLHGRSARAAEEIAAYEEEIERLNGEIESLSAMDKQLRRSFTEAEVRYYDAESKKNDLRGRIDALTAQELGLQSEMDHKTANIDFLKSLIESREGLPESARFLSTTERWNPRRRLTVADAIYADEQFRNAIESALGDYAGLIIVDSIQDAESGMALLRQEQRGKATFVCLDRIPEIRSHVEIPEIPGVLGWAADLAKCDAFYVPLLRCILDRVLVVDTAGTAKRIVAMVPGIRCVTLQGEIATGVGITKGGGQRGDERRMIGKQSRIDEHTREIVVVQENLARLRDAKGNLAAEYDALNMKVYSDAVKSVEKEMSGIEMQMAQLQFEKKRAGDIIGRNREEIDALSEESAGLLADIDGGMPGLQTLVAGKTEAERNIGALSNELAGLEVEWNNRSRMVNDLGIRIVTFRGERQNAQNELERAAKSIANIVATLVRRNEDIRRSDHEIVTSQAEVQENSRILEDLRRQRAEMEAAETTIEHESEKIREEIHSIEMKVKDERRTHDDVLQAAHELELKIADLRAKSDHIAARAQEEYEITIELKSYPETEFVDFAALREDIHALREKMKTLGNINFAAFEEYNTEKERFEFLSSQRKDLLEAEKTLLATIEEINSAAQRKFLESFEKIRANFIETFKSLFDPGDECDLKLEEGVDPLEAKIEIIAKPRGKRPTSIDLLSGGEKTLTAIALLFAIYLVKPSPFCILDEVDAPLDDANIDRFTRILRKFSDNTQFIVVTHNKRTMEAASAMYGVTMEEEGVSKLVTVRFSREAEVRSAAVASG